MKQNIFSGVKRVALTLLVSGLSMLGLEAVPAYRGWLTMEQPDGTTIEIQQTGDEFYHYAINRDGKQVKQNAEGYWVEVGEAPTEAVAKARRAKAVVRRQRQAVGTKPNLAPKGVVILANFKDTKMQSSHTQAVFDELCNSTNCTVNKYNNVNYGSAAQYFADQSNGSYRPVFDVYGPVTLSRDVAYYGTDKDTGDPEEDEGDDQHATDAVVEACILANEQFTINWADYDSDNDGKVDFVYLIYAGKGQADGGSAETIWPHNWDVTSAISYKYCTYTNAQRTLGGKKIDNYACSAELSGSSLSGIGTLCHEFGHVMGLPDLYDTEYEDVYRSGTTPNDWNIMDGGSYNGDGHCPPNYDPWQKQFFGWLTPINLGTDGQDISIRANGTTGAKVYQINSTNKYQDATTGGVCYYIENRQKQGWDAPLTGHGLLVWKVNFNATAWSNNAPNTTGTNNAPLHSVVSASGTKIGYTYDYNNDGQRIKNSGKDNCPWNTFPGTKNVKSYTPISGHALTEITESDGVITFKYNGGNVDYWSYSLAGEHCTVPADGTLDKGAPLNLTITADEGYTLADADCWAVEMGDELLEYGTGFTYNETNGAFAISSVTGNVYIIASAKAIPVTITWKANGSTFTTTNASGTITLPTNEPEACEGKVFVGWCATANYSSPTTAPTFVKTGDAVSEATTFYAVFATEEEGGEGSVVTFNANNQGYSNGSVAGTKTIEGVKFAFAKGTNTSNEPKYYTSSECVHMYPDNTLTISADDNITSMIYVFSRYDGWSVNTGTWTKDSIWTGESKSVKFTVNSTTGNQVRISKIKVVIGNGVGVTYSDYTTSCTPPTKYTITILDAEHGTLTTTPSDEAVAGKTVTLTATPTQHYHLAALSVKDADESDVALSGTGNTRTFTMPEKAVTISGSFAEDDKYTVRFLNNGEVISSEQYYLGETADKPANPTAQCDDYTFVGWWTAELAKDNTAAKTWITNFTVTGAQDYYAVFIKTEIGEGESAFDGQASGNYKIYALVKDIKYYATTIESNKLLSTTDESEASTFVFEKVTDGFTITLDGEYLKYNGSKTDISTSGTKYTWSITNGTAGTWRVNSATNKRALAFNSETGKFGGYSTDNIGSGYYDLEIGGGGPSSVTYYSTQVSCQGTDLETATKQEPARKILRNGQILILRGEAVYTLTGTRIE